MKLVVALTILLIACSGDSTKDNIKRAQNTTEVVDYKEALRRCKEEGKDAGDYTVYENCARKADVKYGLDGGK